MYLAFLFGNRPGYQFTYFNPWVNRELHLTTGLFLKKYSKENREIEFNEKHLVTGITLGKHWTRDFYNRLHFSRDEISVNEEYTSYMQTKSKHDVLYSLYFTTVYDLRDLYAYPTTGWFLKLELAKKGFFVPEIDYFQYDLDIRKYLSWNKLIFAGRFTTKQSIGELPIYNKVYLGFNERIRGHFFEVISGRHNFVSSFEIRFPLLQTYYFDFPIGVVKASSTRDLKFGINAGFFVETGLAWQRKNELAMDNLVSGFGAGIHFIMPYIEVLRIDLAFDEDFNSETILEIGVAF